MPRFRPVALNKRLNIQRRLAWSLCKDDTHNRREAKPFFAGTHRWGLFYWLSRGTLKIAFPASFLPQHFSSHRSPLTIATRVDILSTVCCMMCFLQRSDGELLCLVWLIIITITQYTYIPITMLGDDVSCLSSLTWPKPWQAWGDWFDMTHSTSAVTSVAYLCDVKIHLWILTPLLRIPGICWRSKSLDMAGDL